MQAPLAAQPTDVTVTPDGDLAIVRSTSPVPGSGTSLLGDHLSVWDLSTRTRVALTVLGGTGQTPGLGEFSAGAQVSDLVETTNTKALCAGAVGNTTYIDVIALPDALNPNATVIASHTISTSAGTTLVAAGEVNDVAIVEARQIGIVNHHNQVHFVSLRTGAILAAFDLSRLGMPPGMSGEVSPLGATDSIAVTNDRAVVITTRYPGFPQSMPWVFFFDITTPTAITNTYASAFLDRSLTQFEEITSIARSVRIPADLRQAVMTADYIVASRPLVPVVGPPNPSNFPAYLVDPLDTRKYEVIRDSLEVTNSRAVVLSSYYSLVTGAETGRIRVVDIATLTVLGGQQPYDSLLATPTNSDRTHDLAIAPDGTVAVVKTEQANVLVSNLAGPGSATFGVQNPPAPGNPLAGQQGTPPLFPSDSVAISADGSTAVLIGTRLAAAPGSKDSGIVDFIALTTAGVSGTIVISDLTYEVHPTDLKFSRDNSRVG